MLNIEFTKGTEGEALYINDKEPTIENIKEVLHKLIDIDRDKSFLESVLIDYMITLGSEEYITYVDEQYDTKYTLNL